MLLFVAPEARLESLWPELCRLVEKEAKFDLQPIPERMGIKSAMVDGGKRRLMLTSWRALLDSMLSATAAAGDAIESDIRQLCALCEREDEDAFLPIAPEELGPSFPRRMLHLNRLVDDATERAKEIRLADTDRLRVWPQAFGYGRYLRLGAKDANLWAGAWFGIDYRLWAKSRQTPLWITFFTDNWDGVIAVDELRQRLGEDIWANTERSIPIDLPTGVEYKEVLDSVVERLSHIAEQIGN